MSIFETHNLGLKAAPEGDTYYEQWVAGTYIVAGVFQRRQAAIGVTDIQTGIPGWFDLLKARKKARWPRGLCGYFAIPIYTCDSLDQAAVEWVHARPRYRYAMWHEPVLYDRVRNAAEMNAAGGLRGSAFHVFVFEVVMTALHGLARKEGHASLPLLNGARINILNDGPPGG